MTRGFPLAKDGPDPADIGSTPLDVRRALTALIDDTPGVVYGLVVTGNSGPAWGYDVTGGAWIGRRGADAATDGITATYADGQTVPTDAAPGAGSRWDIIYAHQRNTEHGDADGEGVIEVQIGTVGGAAPVGDLPAGAVELARYQISAGMANTAAATRVTSARVAAGTQATARAFGRATTAAAARAAIGIPAETTNPPLGQLLRSAATATTTSEWTTITGWSSEPLGRKGGMDFTSQRLVVPVTGIYRLDGRAEFAADATGRRGVGFLINGTQRPGTTGFATAPASGSGIVSTTVLVALTAGDTVTLTVNQDSGGALNCTLAMLTVAWVRS